MAAAPLLLTLGEALFDWVSTERGADLARARNFVKAPGGAPFNVAVGLARLGARVAFVGRLGDDPFGHELRAIMQREGVDVRYAAIAPGSQTRMAYVVTNAAGDRELAAFSTIACADAALRSDDLPEALFAEARALCFGSLMLRDAAAREGVLGAARRMHAAQGLSVFDPNARMVLWPDADELRAVLERALAVSDLVKLGDEELAWLTGSDDTEHGAAELLARHSLTAVLVTHGAAGSYYRSAGASGWVPSFPVTCVDATGAGDAFVAGLLAGLAARDDGRPMVEQLARMGDREWQDVLRQANAVGAIATTHAGAISALPRLDELETFLATTRPPRN